MLRGRRKEGRRSNGPVCLAAGCRRVLSEDAAMSTGEHAAKEGKGQQQAAVAVAPASMGFLLIVTCSFLVSGRWRVRVCCG